jgi:hypothetical protein
MKPSTWIGLGVGALAAGAAVLYSMGKKVATPGYGIPDSTEGEPVVGMGAGAAVTTEQAVNAANVGTQAVADYAALQADKAALEQRVYAAENALNQALAQQTSTGNQNAAAFDAERQALAAQIAQIDTAMMQEAATAAAAQQALAEAQAKLAEYARQAEVKQTAADTYVGQQQTAAEEKKIQQWAAADTTDKNFIDTATKLERKWQAQYVEKLAASTDLVARKTFIEELWKSITIADQTFPGFTRWVKANRQALDKTISSEYAAITAELAKKNAPNYEPNWRASIDILQKSWTDDYPKLTTPAARLTWFTAVDKAIANAEATYPGFSIWGKTNAQALLTALVTERVKVNAAAKTSTVDPSLAAWQQYAAILLEFWRVQYPKLPTPADKTKALVGILANAKTVEVKYPGFMKWFDKTYPGVVAQMIAEQTRLAGLTKTSPTPGSTTDANTQASPATVNAYNALLAGWAAYKKLPTDQAKRPVMQAVIANSLTPQGKTVWAYAEKVNPGFVSAVFAEVGRLKSFTPTVKPIKIAKNVTKTIRGLDSVDEFAARARQLRDAANVLRADNAQRAQSDMTMRRWMGR